MGMGTAGALAIAGGAAGMYGAYSRSRSQIAALRANAAIAQQQASLNAGYARAQAQAQSATTLMRSQYESEMLGLSAQAYRRSGQVAQQDASQARSNSRFRQRQLERRNYRLAGMQKAAYGKAGVVLEGTAKDVMFDSALEGELEVLAEKYMGDQQVRRHLVDSYNQMFSGDMADYNASTVLSMGRKESQLASAQGEAAASIALTQGRLESMSLLGQVSGVRNQGYIDMAGSALSAGAMYYGAKG